MLIKTMIKKLSSSLAVILWCLFTISITYAVRVSPGKNTVTPAYWNASINWIKGTNIYEYTHGFIYLPQSAIIQIPFALLPFPIAEILWRVFNISFYALACYLISSLFPRKTSRALAFLGISIFAIPLAYLSARYGQANLILASLLAIAAYLLANDKYVGGIFICILGLAIKPYTIVPLLFIFCLYPKRSYRPLILGSIILFLFPFFFQTPSYVWLQYREYLRTLRASMLFGQNGDFAYFFNIFKSFGIKINFILQAFFTLIFTFLTFLFCLNIFRNKPIKENAMVILTLTIILSLLFNPRTENNTYCLMGPFIAYFFMKSFSLISKGRVIHLLIMLFCYITMLVGYDLGQIFTPGKNQWLAPLGLTIFTCYILLFTLPKMNPD